MDSSHRQHAADDPVDKIAQHLFNNPSDIRHVCKLMRHFHASAADVGQAINRIAHTLTLLIDPHDTADKVLMHLLRHPEDLVDVRWVMRRLNASGGDVQQALEKLETYIVEGGEGEVHAIINKE